MQYGETIKTWTVALDGEEHVLRFQHNFWTGEKNYYVDDALLKSVPGGLRESARFARDVPFSLGLHQGVFRLRAIGRLTFYDLFIDGEKIEGRETSTPRLPLWAGILLMLVLFAIAGLSILSGK